MRDAAGRAGLPVVVDSAGTGDWHVGRPPDPRTIATAARHGIDISGYRARQVTPDDFETFDHMVALDASNLSDLRSIAPPGATAKLSLLMDHVDGRYGTDVADPYFGEAAGFEITWRDVVLGADGLLVSLCDQPSG